MPPVTELQLHTQLESGVMLPVYVLLGDDDVAKADVAAEFAASVDEGLRAFNLERLYGGEMTFGDLLQAAATFPMMAPRRVVIVLEAEKFLTKRESAATEEEEERLIAFIKDPPRHATVVFVCGALDGRRRVARLLREQAGVVDCGTIEDAAAAERWVRARAAKQGAALEPGALRAIVERGGNDLVRLRSGLERVLLYAMGQPKVTADDVKSVMPEAPDAPENFGIANAIRDGDTAGALRQLTAALENGAAPPLVLGQIRVAAEGAAPRRVREAVDALFRTDLALKSSGGDPRILLERLVVELCGLKSRGGR